MRAGAVVVAAVLAAGAAGCAGASDAQQVRATLALFARSVAQRDYQTLCRRVLAPSLIANLGTVDLACEVVLAHSTFATVQAPRLTVLRVTVKGKGASALVHSGAPGEPPSTDVVELVSLGGVWKIADLAAPAPTRATPPRTTTTTPPTTTTKP